VLVLAPKPAAYAFGVAQSGTLLYRRIAFCRTFTRSRHLNGPNGAYEKKCLQPRRPGQKVPSNEPDGTAILPEPRSVKEQFPVSYMKSCLFSVSYAGLWGQASLGLPEFIERAGCLGYASVMLMGKRPHLSVLDAGAGRLAPIQSALRTTGVRCEVVAGYTHFAPATAAEVPVIEMQIAYIETLARLGAELGARIVRIFTAYESDRQDPQAAWLRVVTATREICDRVAPLGMTVAVQNHHDLALDTDALIELCAEIDRPNCKLGFDAWSPALRGEDIHAAARKAAPHMVLTTNADYRRVPRYRYRPEFVNYERQSPDWVRAVTFGTGCIDYEGFFAGLREGGFDGIAAYEMCSPVAGGGAAENLDAKARAYLEWMRQHGLVAS
jgi:sugar phosphate isomerase/epimerase